MIRPLAHTECLDSYFQDEDIIPYASAPTKQCAVPDFEDNIDAEGRRFFKGLLVALPISALFWGLILLALKSIIF